MHILYKLPDQGAPSTHTNAAQGSSSCPWSSTMSKQKATAGMWAQKAIHNPLPMGKRRRHRTDPLSSMCASAKECHTGNNRNNNPSSAFSCFKINPMKTNWKTISKYEPISSLSWRRWKVSAATQEMALSKILVKFIIKAAGTYSDISEEILADVRS